MTHHIDYQPIADVDLQPGKLYTIVIKRLLPSGDPNAVASIERAPSPAYWIADKEYWAYPNARVVDEEVVGIIF